MGSLYAAFLASLITGSTACVPSPVPEPAPRQVADLEMVLNIPAFRLDVYADSGLIRTFTVAPGQPRYRTPTGDFAVFSVTFNPWWYPPPGAAWARKEKVTPPGPANPMGRVKLNFHELYFLHGTPAEHSIGTAASHGCVRMHNQDALELAELVMRSAGPDLPPGTVEMIERSGGTRTFRLENPVPIHIVYRVAEVTGDTLRLHPDVYGRARLPLRREALEALRLAGIDTAAVDRAALDTLARRARRRHVAVAVARVKVAKAAGSAEVVTNGGAAGPRPRGRAPHRERGSEP